MVMNFDLQLFCENLKATKPPYECPIDGCGKIYKSYAGIHHHLYNYDHENPDGGLSPNSVPPNSPGRQSNARQIGPNLSSVCNASSHESADGDSALWVEVDLSGCTYKINIHEPLVLINDEAVEKPEKELTEKNTLCGAKDAGGFHKAGSNGSLSQCAKLPEAHFKVLDDYVQPSKVPSKPSNYYRFIEKTQEELEDEVEYDLDEEDFVWLELMNDKRKKENLPPISKDVLELLLDRFEKHCYFEVKSSRRLPRDEDAICSVCLDGECHINNVILFCDLCNLAVHQECYGVPHIPEGSWICRRCLLSPSKSVECCLCPNRRGAFKQTEDGRWAHVICALWIPEVGFANSVFLEPIDGIKRIAAARWKLACYICKQRGVGACVQCHKTSCYTAFHVTCAQQAGLYMKTEPIRDTGVNGTTLSIRKTAFCDMHSPLQSELASVAISSSEDDRESSCSSLLPAEARAKSRLKLRKARKALAESRNSSPVLAVPVISPESIKGISDKVSFHSKEEFICRLCSYWSLKRKSKNGVPLLRTSMSSIHVLRNRGGHQPLHSPTSSGSPGNKSKSANAETTGVTLEEQFKYCKKLRQQLEKVRLLNELIRKREKLKQEQMKLHQQVLQLQLSPFSTFLSQIFDHLQEGNTEGCLAKPPLGDSVEYVTEGILDLTEMQDKLRHHRYSTVDEMSDDFNVLISNYTKLHSADSQKLKACLHLKDQGAVLFRGANQLALGVGFDPKTGLHLSHHSGQLAGHSGLTNDEKPTITEDIPTNRTIETDEVSVQNSMPDSTQSQADPELATLEPVLASRPVGINRRSAVLHSKKARQSAMRLFHSLEHTQRKPSDSKDDCKEHKDADSIDAKTTASLNENPLLVMPDGKVKENNTGTTTVETTLVSLGDDREEIDDAAQDLPTVDVTASGDDVEDHPCDIGESIFDLGSNAGGEQSNKRRGLKRLRSESEMNISPGMSDHLNAEEQEDDEEIDDGHRQYATRGKRQHSQSTTDSEDIVIPLEPLDLVWAKCTGFPWYPALVIDPKMSKTAAFHNSVPLPVPPPEVLNLRKKYCQPVFLVSFFDARRTWQWLPREKLDPLGVDSGLDNAKLAENKKPSMRQAVRMAYQKAIRHRCSVTGEPLPVLSGLA